MDFFEVPSAYLIPLLSKLGMALLTLVLGFWIIGWITKAVDIAFQKRNFDPTVERFLHSLIEVTLKVMLLLSVAGMFGVQTTSFIAIFTALAFSVGTALSGSLSHFASGVLLLVFRPYKVGDLVNLGGGQTGDVEEIQMFNTVLRTLDNRRIFIPNNLVTSNIIINVSGQGEIRVDMEFATGPSTNLTQVRALAQLVADACPTVLRHKPLDVLIQGTTPGSVKIVVRPWCKSSDYWETFHYFQEHLREQFMKNGVPDPLIEG